MILFLLSFFLLYGGLHFYFFMKIRAAFAPGAAIQGVLAALLILGLLAPLIVRASERSGLEVLARLMSWGGYLWMAIIFLFFSVSLLLDMYRLLAYTAGLVLRTDVVAYLPSARMFFLIPIAAALIIGVYGFFEAREIRQEHIEIFSNKIPKDAGKIRIVQISDVHVGVLVREKRLAAILRKVREAQPDLLVSTGDLVDGQLNSMAEAIGQFRDIRPRYGKFAVTGNHEFYAGIDDAIDFITRSGFILLRGEVADAGGVINIAGVDDPTTRRSGLHGSLSDREVLSLGGGDRFTILLKHQPLVEKDTPGAFDLQLSGHTHRGQIFPFSLITGRFFPYHSGNYRLEKGALLHVSRGTGTWGPPIRFLSPPEITVIDLIPR
ncbi:MAG: metallophosphoesterase [Syntrophales bacterium]|nr:metallophosphoesterase [Syntrophales bacterium]